MTSYRAVIGLAGHVDHGKTLLIKALTGITTARAHEQAIGMTQDLGFAHFDDGQGNTIGVIDVPGHERYIRNMVAGLWSLDLVLLVIAADEGWMPMTGDHLRLLKAMGVPRLLVCINKCDLVTPDELLLLEESLLERVMDESGMVPDIVSVSAKTGANMAALHTAIVRQLGDMAEHHAPREQAAPRLYVDRVFTANGTGTVLTGTLQQGSLKVGDKLRLYPADREVQVRSLQAYHQSVDEIGAVCRVAVGLKKVPHKEVARGHCLTSAAGQCEAATHLIVRLCEVGGSIREQRNREVEVALGSWHGRARFVPIKDTRLARLIFASPIPCFFGQPLAIIRHGSSELLHGARIVWCGDIHPARRKTLHALLGELPDDLDRYNPATLQLGLNGYVAASRFDQRPEQVTPLGEWLLDNCWLAQSRDQLLATLASEPLSAAELATRFGIALPVIQALLQQLKSEQLIRLHHDKWQPGSGESEDDLGEEAQLVLKVVRDQGKEGYEPGKLGPGGVELDPFITRKLPAALQQGLLQKGALQKQLRNLARLKYLVQLDGPIYYDAALYNQMVAAVLAGQQVGDLIDMASFKEITGLSRKYAIPFCLRMEMDGWVRREENERRVLRLPATQDEMELA
ncbi:selenocysteine-specific translation elongation factor [Aeromonas hydrophila]|uniref:Selenocysteine-specific elongation factor n=1 Tax=Aeromonas hydrophila subsp. hydrophila (strain ATCC 7966 / DSM 30187 / BCRC 13018 / CCUG 14551 / JCM 1027 / KCTC 2358 / NCIMB 9240 / NCTC 8049) TaxID=380703 RepID=A0KL71_AERHH|nr:selenocysteine-specific translation elongation factor [Aeromonas hydrophila]ABK36702.1 selenocysteine-specific translation elongation factor [Aeromonas hydrophila subsp. hydrophila ATCC 7966]MBS4672865.1 selenocysteine-specific translation elongation factor [Aeromonas hydrophila]OOD33523.1 selenocysteine-specific translation elongation factor [Aeromonas hydrophila]SUU28981.1 selenocysteine-specific translation elongation factor [Aeromonas hydrophila]